MSDPHFVRDYRALNAKFSATLPIDEAMSRVVGGGDYNLMGAKQAELLTSLGLSSGHCLIEIGCGSGRLSSQLSKQFGDTISYLGIDVVPELLDYARSKAALNYKFSLTSGLTIPASPPVDFACAFSVFTHLRQSETTDYFRDVHRVLRPGGVFVFSFLELPYAMGLFCLETIRRIKGSQYPETNFLSRKSVAKISSLTGFGFKSFWPQTRTNICLSYYPEHSFAVLTRL